MLPAALPPRMRLCEMGPRDGLQNQPQHVSATDKRKLIELLYGAGIRAIEATSLHEASLSVMFRTALFPAARARGRATTPCPREFFLALAEALRDQCARRRWVLPSLRQCLHAERVAAGVSPAPAARWQHWPR